VDAGTQLIAFSGVQTATGHRSDIAAISGLARAVGAIVFVDGSQLVGALPVAHDLPYVEVLTAPDHKFLLKLLSPSSTTSDPSTSTHATASSPPQ